jgi:hypothetical protein
MSTIKANAYLDASGGNNATINGILPVNGSMTLLGTLETTSGTTQTLSGMTLTPYKYLLVVFAGAGVSVQTATISFDGGKIVSDSPGAGLNLRQYGHMWVSLTGGTYSAAAVIAPVFSGAQNDSRSGYSSLTTATTSISFTVSTGTFNAGSILIYGVK